MKLKLVSAILAAVVMTGCQSSRDEHAHASLGPCDASCDISKETANRVYFGFDQYQLDDKNAACIAAQAVWLKHNPNARVVFEGHADERGTREYNLALGERRASAVRKAMVAHGIDAQRTQVVSFGKDNPPADANTNAERRVVVTKLQ